MSRQPKLFDGQVCFITFTVTGWVDVFTRPAYKHIMIDSIRYCQKHKGLLLYAWCLMSNHIHLIAGAPHDIALNDIVRDLKKHTSKKIVEAIGKSNESRKEWMLNMFRYVGKCHPKNIQYKFWKDGYDCLELFSPEVYEQKLNYIHNNPVTAEIVDEPHEYLYSSAKNYADLPGLLDVIVD